MDKMPTNIKILLGSMIVFAGLIAAGILININGAGLGANIFDAIGDGQDKNIRENTVNGDRETKSDIDKDGLFDHEEVIYRTDPLNPDTDGDGFLDGEEAAAGCLPTVPPPNDCDGPEKAFPKDRPITQRFSELILGGLVSGDLKSDNPEFSKSISVLQNELLLESNLLLTIDSSEIEISPWGDDSKEARQMYIDNLGSVLERYLTKNSPEQNFQFGVSSPFEYFGNGLDSTKKLKKEIKAMVVPSSWTEFHKKVFMLIEKTEIFYQNILDYENDPLKALLTLNNVGSFETEYKKLVSEALKKIKEQRLSAPPDNILYLLSTGE